MDGRAKPPNGKAKTKRPLARKSPKTDAPGVHELETRLAEALEQQAATAEILRVISRSPTDTQPVFNTIVASAARLCDADFSAVARFEGGLLHLVAVNNMSPAETAAYHTVFPRAPGRHFAIGRAFVDARPVHIEDIEADPDYDPWTRQILQGAAVYRTFLGVPILQNGVPIGAIGCGRHEMRPFTASQIELVKTFADQAVIAVENVRLFTELQARNSALTESLDQQTATGEILRVISSSPTDVQPVFAAVAASAARLCDAFDATIFQVDTDGLRVVARVGPIPAHSVGQGPSMVRGTPPGRAVLDRRTIHVADMQTEIDEYPEGSANARRFGHRTTLVVPLLHAGEAIGAIAVRRTEVRPFTDRQVELLKTFADQAVIAIENVRLFNELQRKNEALTEAHAQVTEALDQQTATSEILRVISSSPTDVQPVLDAVAESAARLCDAAFDTVNRFDGRLVTLGASYHVSPEELAVLQRDIYPFSPTRQTASGRALIDRATVHIHDIRSDPQYTPVMQAPERYRTVLAVPMLREGTPIGNVTLWRREVRPFSDKQIELVKTFADQAVIAIENVRLFTELQEKNRALTEAHTRVTEALEQQTATSEILRVISSSPTDVQPVFDTIVRSAVRLCDGLFSALFRFDGERLHPVALHNLSPEALEILRRTFPMRPSRSLPVGRAILDCAVAHVPDVDRDPEYRHLDFVARGGAVVQRAHLAHAVGWRSALAVPLLREGGPIGAIFVGRAETGSFSDGQVALLQTFADQAVIAIENVRLFTELQEKNRALTQAHEQVTQALEQQTATSEILRVISSSLTDVQPVFDAIAGSATRLCDALYSVVFRFDGDTITLVADDGASPEQLEVTRSAYPAPPGRRSVAAQAILERRVIAIADAQSGTEYPHVAERAKAIGYRSIVSVPMLRGDTAIGAINVLRVEALPFSDTQIELLKTFADQAVIAIENVRLFKELEARTAALTRSVDQLTALGEVGRAVTSTLDLETVLTTIVSRAVQLSGLDGGVVFEYDDGAEEFVQRVTTETDGALAEARRTTRIRKGEGVLGRTAITLEPVQVPDIAVPGAYEGRLRETLIASGVRAILAVPMVRENRLIGCLGVTRNRPGEFPVETIELLRTFATQSALAIQNARLFHEIEDKSRQLEVVSQHKSEFLANMSHELRTPLNAIIGFSEVLSERMFGELNEKQEEYLRDIYASGQHLLSLINDILDLSKIEAGRMELELTDFDLPQAIDNAMMLVRERAERRGISLSRVVVDRRLGQIRGDERKIRQVVLNLLSNAIKFTPEGGCIEVRAVPADGRVEVSVSDTGVGIAPEDQEAVFEEFRQVGASATKQEGTGLGLTLCRKFVELHGGKIWVKSQVGGGSTFTFTLPLTTNQRRQTA